MTTQVDECWRTFKVIARYSHGENNDQELILTDVVESCGDIATRTTEIDLDQQTVEFFIDFPDDFTTNRKERIKYEKDRIGYIMKLTQHILDPENYTVISITESEVKSQSLSDAEVKSLHHWL